MSATMSTPESVERALRKSLELGYLDTTRSETGRLLSTLAATRTGVIAECGTGTGVGAAWLRHGAPDDVRVLTAESDPHLAAQAQEALAGEGIEVVNAEFRTLAEHGPFDLIFADVDLACGARDRDIAHTLLSAGGLMVIDNLSPAPSWPPMRDGTVDAARVGWHNDARFVTSEVLIAPDAAVLLATRR